MVNMGKQEKGKQTRSEGVKAKVKGGCGREG